MIADLQDHRRGVGIGHAAWLAASLLAHPQAQAADATPLPPYTGDRVYVRDVPDRYGSLAPLIRDLERRSPQTYFVVVVKSAEDGDRAAIRYVDRLYDAWCREAPGKGLKLDPDRSVIVLVALEDRKVAVHTGTALHGLGLHRSTVNALIGDAFVPLARAGDHAGAASALLIALNNEVAKHDRATAAYGTPAGGSRGGQVVLAILGSLVAVALIAAALVWLGRRRTRSNVERKIKDYKHQAVDLMDRLDALKKRLEALPVEDPDFKEPMTGATLAHYEKLKQDVTRLWDRWLEVMDALDKAQSLAGKDSALGQQKLKEAEKLVSDPKTFEEIDAGARASAAGMDVLNNAHEQARAAVEAVGEGQAAVRGRIEDVRKVELPTDPYQPELEGVSSQAEQAKSMLTADPLGAKATLDQALERIKALRERLELILQRFGDARQLSDDLRALGDQVAGHRRQGLRLDEDGGNPDEPMGRTFQALEGLRKALHDGDPAAAAERLREGQSALKEAQQALDAVLAAKASCEKDRDERARETRRLREAMGQYEAFQSELERDFAAGSWQAAAGNLAQARSLLDTFDRKAAEAAEAAAAQKHLLGARLLAQLGAEQQAVFRLMSAVGEQLQALRALREECRQGLHELEDQDHAIAREFDQDARAVGAMARQSLASARESLRQLADQVNGSRPDWPRLRQLLARTQEEYAIARSQADTDRRLYQDLYREYRRVRQEADRVRGFLAGREEDRLAANQHYRAAEDALTRVEQDGAGGDGEWARLLEQVRGASADLEHAERLAREDIQLAQQAERELHEAAQTMQRTRGYFAMGLSPPMVEAEGRLAQAQRLYQAQEYEQAIRTAGDAIRQIRAAHHAAVQQALWQQMQEEADQRRRAASGLAVGLGAAAAGLALGMGAAAAGDAAEPAFGPPGPDEPAPFEPLAGPEAAMEPPAEAPETMEPDSSTGSGGWSSETTERSW